MSESGGYEGREPGASSGQEIWNRGQGCCGCLLPALGGIWLVVGGILLWIF